MMMILCGMYVVQAQTPAELTYTINKEGKIRVFPKYKTYELAVPAYTSYKLYTPFYRTDREVKLKGFVPTPGLPVDDRPMDMQVLSAAYRPFFDIYAPMMRAVSPMAYDFRETSIVPINEKMAFFVTGAQDTWLGMGGQTTISPGMIWHQDKWTIAGGGFAGRFYTPFNPSPGYVVGAQLQIGYDVNERVALRTWGKYAQYGNGENYNPQMLMSPFFNHTSVGGTVEYMLNEHFGIGGGVNYEYNPYKRRMEPQYLLYPVFKTKNVQIGIW
jgi:hypothetical protein